MYQVGINKGITLYMFWTVSSSIIRSPRLYIQHQVYVKQVLWLLASGTEFHLSPANKQPQNLYDMYLILYVQFTLLMMDGETVRNV